MKEFMAHKASSLDQISIIWLTFDACCISSICVCLCCGDGMQSEYSLVARECLRHAPPIRYLSVLNT